METAAFRIMVGVVASLGIMASDLPDLIAYQSIILAISALIRWNKDETWKHFALFLALAQVLGVMFFKTNWDNIYVMGNFPITGIAVIVGIIVSFPKEMVLKVKNFRVGTIK